VLHRLGAGAAAAGTAALALAGRAGARVNGERRKKRRAPEQTFQGKLRDITYTPIGSGNTDHYLITGVGNGGVMTDVRKDRKIRMTDARLFRYMDRRSDGDLGGHVCFGLEGINWRLHQIDYDKQTGLWRLDARVCKSNPDARPTVSSANDAAAAGDLPAGYNGCSCACTDDCYHCGADSRYNGYSWCGFSYKDACL
jgi:hypothetical protein